MYEYNQKHLNFFPFDTYFYSKKPYAVIKTNCYSIYGLNVFQIAANHQIIHYKLILIVYCKNLIERIGNNWIFVLIS